MTVLQIQSPSRPGATRTEVCANDHTSSDLLKGALSRSHREVGRVGPVATAPRRVPAASSVREVSNVAVLRLDSNAPAAAGRSNTAGARRDAGRTLDRRGSSRITSPGAPVAPGRRRVVRPATADSVRACRVSPGAASARERVVDDVPTWALLACGVVLGLVLMALVVLLGGPAYA